MPDPNIEILKKESFIKCAENSVGTRMFNSLMVKFKDTGQVKDILNDGELSCAFFASALLHAFKLIDRPVSTVESLKQLVTSNDKFTKISNDIQPGDIIFWHKVTHDDGTETAHVGFAIDKNNAVSTSYKEKTVVKHEISNRPLDEIFRPVF